MLQLKFWTDIIDKTLNKFIFPDQIQSVNCCCIFTLWNDLHSNFHLIFLRSKGKQNKLSLSLNEWNSIYSNFASVILTCWERQRYLAKGLADPNSRDDMIVVCCKDACAVKKNRKRIVYWVSCSSSSFRQTYRVGFGIPKQTKFINFCIMLRASVLRLFSQPIRQTVYLRECLDTTAFPNTLKLYSTQTAVKEQPGTTVSEKEAEETRIGKRRPLENAPFIRELFLGRFAKVN